MRPDLRQAFPDLDGDDGPGLLAWTTGTVRKRWGWRHTGSLADPDHRRVRAAQDEHDDVWGVNVAGYLRSELGVGEVARAVIASTRRS